MLYTWFFGGILLRYIGAATRWLITNFINLIKKKKIVSFKNIIQLPSDDDFFENVSYEMTDVIIGIIVLSFFFVFIYLYS
jgi:hypothetical protein